MLTRYKNYKETISKIFVGLCFTLSLIISATIVFHSFEYLETYFNNSSSFLLVLTIELAYISLPYVSILNFNKKKLFNRIDIDILAISLLFMLSIIPASLQSSSIFVTETVDKIVIEPIEPEKPEMITFYRNEIDKISKQMENLDERANSRNEKEFFSKADEQITRIDSLYKKKEDYVKKVEEFEKIYAEKMNSYRIEKRKYDGEVSKNAKTGLFDFLKITWSFFLVGILQLINGRFMFHGISIIKGLIDNQEKEIHTPHKINDADFISVPYIESKFKVTGLGPKTIEQFIQNTGMTYKSDLEEFIRDNEVDDAKELFSQHFNKMHTNILLRMFRKMKKSYEDSNEGTE